MKKISYWAKKNQKLSWILITTSHLVLMVLAFQLSKLLTHTGIRLNGNLFYLIAVLFIPLIVFYPSRKQYNARKGFDLLLTLQGFVLFIILFNTDLLRKENSMVSYAAISIADSSVFKFRESGKILSDFRTAHRKLSKEEGRILRKELKHQSKKWLLQKENGRKDNTIEIIGIIVLALALSYGVLLLACSISCAGAETLAVIVAIGGIGVLIGLTIIAIKNLNKRTREQPRPEQKV